MTRGRRPGRRSLWPLGGVLAATAVSLTGTRVSAVALPWFVLVTTGSTTRTGLVAFCEMAPYVVVKAFAGPLVDRAGPRAVSWTTDLVSASAAAAIPLTHAAHLRSFALLLALVAVIGAARGPGDLAKGVMVPAAADRCGVPLTRATGLAGVTERLASTVGPAAGGALVALAGPLTGLAADAACFALGSVIIGLALPHGMGRPATGAGSVAGSAAGPTAGGTGRGYWRRFGEGFTFLRAEPLLLTVVVMVGVTNLLDAGFTTLLMPVRVMRTGGGPAEIGLMNGVMGATAVVGSLIATVTTHRLRRRVVFFAGFLLAGAPKFLILATGASPRVVLAVFAVGGFGFLNPLLGAVLLERIPRDLLGWVIALGDSLAWAGIPLGGLIAGAAVARAGLVPVLLAGGAVYFLATNLAGLRPEWRETDRAGARRAPAPDPLRKPLPPGPA